MNLLTEFKSKDSNVVSTTPSIVCNVFEDNNGAIEIANMHKMRARTKHIHLVYHHFCEHVIQKKTVIRPIDTLFQMADIFTKPLCFELSLHHRKAMQHV